MKKETKKENQFISDTGKIQSEEIILPIDVAMKNFRKRAMGKRCDAPDIEPYPDKEIVFTGEDSIALVPLDVVAAAEEAEELVLEIN